MPIARPLRSNLPHTCACNLPQAARHLTSEEDSYGNEKGSQKEIQQFEKRIVALHTRQKLQQIIPQRREKEHARHCKEKRPEQ